MKVFILFTMILVLIVMLDKANDRIEKLEKKVHYLYTFNDVEEPK